VPGSGYGIIHYASRGALNINGLGEKTASDMVAKGLVKDISGLYCLTEDDLLKLEGFAEKSAHQLYRTIQKAKKPSFDRFLYALGIRHVGQRGARILAHKYGSLNNLKKATKEDLEKNPEIGPEIASSVKQFFEQDENQKVLDQLARAGLEVQEADRRSRSGALAVKTFVFTGKLDEFTRQEAEDLVERRGGRATSSVSGDTDYVVVGEEPGTKFEEARKKRIKTIDEEAFKKLLSP
jgi:DNA ligase (NAD+)